MLKSHQRGDLTSAETKVAYLRFAKVLYEEMDSSDSARRMEALNITELKERKCACFTSEEKTHETIKMVE